MAWRLTEVEVEMDGCADVVLTFFHVSYQTRDELVPSVHPPSFFDIDKKKKKTSNDEVL